ncbi:hypothetical protein J7K25_01270 [bacterium]|nr:hypothetical protein [bacterium]
MKNFVLMSLVFGLVFLGNSLIQAEKVDTPIITIGKATLPPEIDGKVEKEEWEDATEIINFRSLFGKHNLGIYPTRVYVMFDKNNLYIGWKFFVPIAKFRANVKERDGSVWDDDSIEIFLDPAYSRSQYYQIIVNSIGTIYDAKGGDYSWNSDINCKVNQYNNRWEGEITIPFQDLGVKTPKDRTVWGFNICRDQYKISNEFPTELTMWSYSPVNGFQNPRYFGKLIFNNKAPIVKVLSLGEFVAKKRNIFKISVKNKTPKNKFTSILKLISEKEEKVKHTISGGRISLCYQPDIGDKEYALSFILLDKKSKEVYYYTGIMPFQSKSPLSISIHPYYYKGILKVKVDPTHLDLSGPHCAKLSLIKPGVREKKVIAKLEGEIINNRENNFLFSLEKLIPGYYQLKVSIFDKNNKEVATRTMSYRHPKKPIWWKSKAGVSDKLLPPWTPMRVKDRKILCWGREYIFGKGTWPIQVVTREKSILSSPIQLKAKINNEIFTFNKERIRLINKSATQVNLRYKEERPSFKFESKIHIEYDGLIRIDWVITPLKPLDVEYLTLEIPISDSYCKYFYYPWVRGVRDNSGAIREKIVLPSSSHYIWLGDEERGLAWFYVSDEGWLPYDRTDKIVVSHQNGKVVLKVNILENTTLSSPLKSIMGLQATPVKPLPKNYRTSALWRKHHWRGGPFHWDNSPVSRKEPYNFDLDRIQKAGVKALIMHAYWAYGMSRPEPFNPKDFKRFVSEAHKKGIKVVVYFMPWGIYPNCPEAQMFKDEWCLTGTGWSGGGKGGRPDMCVVGHRMTESFIDYLTYGIKRLIENYDIDGVYYDGYLPSLSTSGKLLTYLDEKGVGTAPSELKTEKGSRPYYDIFETREFGKRVYTLFKTMKKDSIIDQHSTGGGLIMPLCSFVDSHWNGEYFANRNKWPSLDMFRAEFMGEQWGIVPELLSYGHFRTCLAYALIHDVSVRGQILGDLPIRSKIWKIFDDFDINRAKFYPYWSNSSFVKSSNPAAKVSFYKSEKGIILIVSNLTDKDIKTELNWNFSGLGFQPVSVVPVQLPRSFQCRRKETEDNLFDKEKVLLSDSKMSLRIQRRNFRMILLTEKK